MRSQSVNILRHLKQCLVHNKYYVSVFGINKTVNPLYIYIRQIIQRSKGNTFKAISVVLFGDKHHMDTR